MAIALVALDGARATHYAFGPVGLFARSGPGPFGGPAIPPPPPPPPLPPPLPSSSSSPRDPDSPLDALSRLIADSIEARQGGRALSPFELPIVVACRDLIAATIAQLPLVAVRDGRARPDQPALYRRPDPSEPRGRTFERIAYQLTGPGYCWLVVTARDAAGWPMALRVLDADQATATFDAFGRPATVRVHNGRELTVGGPDAEAVWIPASVPRAGELGRSPLGHCARTVDYLAALFDMAGSFWEAGFPSIALRVPQRLDRDQADALKAQMRGAWSRRHEPAVLDMGAELASVGSSAVEAQLVETIATANVEIARVYQVPPSLVNVTAGSSLTYATVVDEFRRWLSIGLSGWLRRIEESFSDLAPYGTVARFDTDELLRADVAGRYAAYATALGGAPWLTVPEVRTREGLEAEPALEPGRVDPINTPPAVTGA